MHKNMVRHHGSYRQTVLPPIFAKRASRECTPLVTGCGHRPILTHPNHKECTSKLEFSRGSRDVPCAMHLGPKLENRNIIRRSSYVCPSFGGFSAGMKPFDLSDCGANKGPEEKYNNPGLRIMETRKSARKEAMGPSEDCRAALNSSLINTTRVSAVQRWSSYQSG
jgi:hypothetical protein